MSIGQNRTAGIAAGRGRRAALRPASSAAGLHLRLGHRQDQRHRPDAPHAARLVDRLRASRLRCVMLLLFAIAYLLVVGVGIWGINIPVAWGFAIVNFVWWIGIGHAGTLISAILLLLQPEMAHVDQPLRRGDDAFAVACAGLFPLLHLGRPWFFYWLFPYPEHDGHLAAVSQPAGLGRVRGLHLLHRLAAVLVSSGLIPDLATLRDRARKPLRADHLRHAGDGLARLGEPLAALRNRPTCCWPDWRRRWWSRCTASSASISPSRIVPGWHSTIFPPYFVAGAIYSGFAMVLTLAIPLRKLYGLRRLHHHAPPGQHGARSCWRPA